MNEAWRIKQGILVSGKIFIFSLFVGCFYHKGPALSPQYIFLFMDYTAISDMTVYPFLTLHDAETSVLWKT